MRIAVLGAGAWGTALAQILCLNGHQTTLWTWQGEHASLMQNTGFNDFLPGVRLSRDLKITADIEDAVRGADLLTLVVPSSAMRATLRAALPAMEPGVGLVCASKGIEQGTLQLLSEVIDDELAPFLAQLPCPIGVLSGPSFAREVARQVPTNLVAASRDSKFAELLQLTFSTPWLRVYTSADPVGVEIGGALKNVIAVAAGASDGLRLGENTRAALITRGIAEISRLVRSKHGSILTLAGLTGIGDLVLTCTGEMSRNRSLGFKIGAGMDVAQALASSDGVAEGYITAKSVHDLARQLDVELPICEAVYSVLYGGKSAAGALADLLSRPLRAEWEQ
jgi:glycerol-3-phosphate dehydrogenase (NAD(P)+)